MINGRRIGIKFPSGDARFYDIDPDGRVYWLMPRRNNLLQRWRVRDEELAEQIRQIAATSSTST